MNETVLERQLRVVELLAQHPEGLAFGELIRILEFPKATLHRILIGLDQSGCVSIDPLLDVGNSASSGRRLYSLGPRLRRLLATAVSPGRMASISQSVLHGLVDQFHETAFLCMLRNSQIESIGMAHPPKDWHGYVNPGHIMPMHAAASAKAILAFRPAAELDGLIDKPLPAFTPQTLTKAAAIRAELINVRLNGIAWCRDEIASGLTAVAAPISLAQVGVIFSVSIVGPSERLKQVDTGEITAALQDAASKLAANYAQEMSSELS